MIYTNNKLIKQNYTNYTKDYNYYTKTHLPRTMYEAYKQPSYNKVYSFQCWCDIIAKQGGYNMRIISATCQRYTIGYLFDKDGETYFGYITPQYHRYCNIKEL